MDVVQCSVDKAQNCWDEHLAQIDGALPSAVNRNSGFTANKLMLGQELNTPADPQTGGYRENQGGGHGG